MKTLIIKAELNGMFPDDYDIVGHLKKVSVLSNIEVLPAAAGKTKEEWLIQMGKLMKAYLDLQESYRSQPADAIDGYKESIKAEMQKSIEKQEQENQEDYYRGVEDTCKYAPEMLDKHLHQPADAGVCEWKYNEIGETQIQLITTCGHKSLEFIKQTNFLTCPFCGKPIKRIGG